MRAVPLLLLAACPVATALNPGHGCSLGDTGPVVPVEHACDVIIDSTLPTTDATDAYFRADIEFKLSEPDPTATITTAIPGAQAVSDDGETIRWVLAEPLAPSTAYSVTLDYCGGTADLNFMTSDIGSTPLPDLELPGRTYVLDLAGARVVEPPGIGDVLTSTLTNEVLLGVVAVDGVDIQMMGAVAVADEYPPRQEFCDPTTPFPLADWSASPYFRIGPQTTTLTFSDQAVTIADLEVTGTFAPDGSWFAGGTLSGVVDTRPLAPLLDDSGDENVVCALAVNFGAACEACPADGEPFCLTLVADAIVGEEVAGLTLREVTGDDCVGCASPTDDTDLSDTCEIID